MKIITRRIGRVIEFGDSLEVTLRPEILDMKLNAGDSLLITLAETNDNQQRILIEEAKEEK